MLSTPEIRQISRLIKRHGLSEVVLVLVEIAKASADKADNEWLSAAWCRDQRRLESVWRRLETDGPI